jgi:endonuclease/exonuclease/phosphatase family metal-dependent hydrolase
MPGLTRLPESEVESVRLRTDYRLPSQLIQRSRIRVASYNVYNLFGPETDRPKPDEELDALAEMIRRIDADVISFAEVDSLETLQHLFRERVNKRIDNENDTYDTFICVPANDRRGINVAFATRLSVRGKMSFSDREFERDGKAIKFSRDLLGVMIQATPDQKDSFLYFVGHLKSKIGGDSAEEKRRLEATEVIDILNQTSFGGPYIAQPLLVAGDLNDDPDSEVIDVLRNGKLDDLFETLQPNTTYPTKLPKRKYPATRLDYLFANEVMKPRMSGMKIHRDAAADRASDHYPISAVMALR